MHKLSCDFFFECLAFLWEWRSQDTAKNRHTCLKFGSRIDRISAKKWCRWCGKPFGINLYKKIRFFWPPTFLPIQIHIGAPVEIWVSISRDVRRITRFALWDIFLIYHGTQSKSTLRWARLIDFFLVFWYLYIVLTGLVVYLMEIALGPPAKGGCRCYTLVSISWHDTYAIMSARNWTPPTVALSGHEMMSVKSYSKNNVILLACVLACCLKLGSDH